MIPPTSLLVTLDVNSLYTSISHAKGIQATRSLLETSKMSGESIQCLDLLTLVLYENFFLFEDTYYVQSRGTAMGSNVAPAYANAFLHSLEQNYIYPNKVFEESVIGYHRYIDDIFFIWTGPPDSLQSFHTYLNSLDTDLQFTINYDTAHIPFLDTMVHKDAFGNLTTDLYTKPTDCNSLLHYSSSHPKATRDSLPRSQFTRISRIFSDPELLPTRLDEMSSKFLERKYPASLLVREKTRALDPPIPISTISNPERVPFVHTYRPLMPKIHSIIRKHWSLLSRAYPNIKTFDTPALMCSRRAPNIKDKLVRANIGSKIPTSTQRQSATRRKDTFPCLSCASCSNIIKSDTVTHPRTGASFPIRGFYTCDSNFVVYVIKCPCGLLYVGETTQHVKDRIASHKSTIRHGKTWLPIPDHFIKHKHTVAQLKYQIIEQVAKP
ncbi:uncharacterized protein [Dendrobates tinctorius]|uniref:uncharacterized protein n=1 Tax=Dendrobates tinctorius TaxID=92724 RepID=UPI003CC9A4A8